MISDSYSFSVPEENEWLKERPSLADISGRGSSGKVGDNVSWVESSSPLGKKSIFLDNKAERMVGQSLCYL